MGSPKWWRADAANRTPEGQAGPHGVAERLVVADPKRVPEPGNSGGCEGASVQGQRRKQRGTGTLAEA